MHYQDFELLIEDFRDPESKEITGEFPIFYRSVSQTQPFFSLKLKGMKDSFELFLLHLFFPALY